MPDFCARRLGAKFETLLGNASIREWVGSQSTLAQDWT